MSLHEEQKELFQRYRDLSYRVQNLGSIVQNPLDEFLVDAHSVEEWLVEMGNTIDALRKLQTATVTLLQSRL